MRVETGLLKAVVFILSLCATLQGLHTAAIANDRADDRADDETGSNLLAIIGRVLSVPTGDTLQILLPDGEIIDVRLAGIESPPPDEQFGSQSHLWLEGQLLNQLVSAECVERDELLYCTVHPDDRNINLVSLYLGFSKLNDHKSSVVDPQAFRSAENHARESQAGVWGR